MPDIELGDGFTIDANIATKRTILLGQPESGKTNGATVIAEGLLKIGVPVTSLDWKGDLYGQRSSADGLSEGFPVVIFGGDHADVDIDEHDGREIGHLVAKDEMPSVIDVSGFATDAERRRFMAAFLRAFLQAKKDAVRPHTLLIDEYQKFAPQNPHGEAIQILSATEQVVGLGRKRGIGIIGTALRAAQLNKNVIELSDLYLFMQVAGRNDLKAIVETLQSVASAEEIKEMREAIPRLGKGEVVAYSPAWLRIMAQHKFRLRETFDSSRTPQVGETLSTLQPRTFAAIDAPALAARIAATREAREAEDPVALRARIKELESKIVRVDDSTGFKGTAIVADHEKCDSDLATMRRRAEAAESDVAVAEAEREAARAQRDKLASLIESLASGVRLIQTTSTAMLEGLALEAAAVNTRPLERSKTDVLTIGRAARTADDGRPQTISTSGTPAYKRAAVISATVDGDLGGAAAQAVLLAVASYPDGRATRNQIAGLTGYSVKKSTLRGALAALRQRGLIDPADGGETVVLTKAGRKAAGPAPAPKSTAETLAMWRGKIKDASAVRCFDELVRVYPRMLSRGALAEAAGIDQTKSTMRGALAKLRTQGIVVDRDGEIGLVDTLFPTGKPR